MIIFEGLQPYLIWLNALLCFLSMIRIATYQRKDSEIKRRFQILAYALFVAQGLVVIRVLFGVYWIPIDPAEVLINGIICIKIYRAGGNMSVFMRTFPVVKNDHKKTMKVPQ